MTVLTGGVRAGKSRLAAEFAERSGSDVYVLVTAEERDAEMAERIAKHRLERPPSWNVIEEPLQVRASIEAVPESECLILDCLTLWVSNLLGAELADAAIVESAREASIVASRRSGTTIVVTNEVGWGIVPANALARRYRDLLGEVNSLWVARSTRSFLVAAGRALELTEPR